MENNREYKETNSFEIQPASSDDANGIALVQEKTWLATYPNEKYGVTEEDIRSKNFLSEEKIQRWKESIEHQNEQNHTFVAKQGDKVVGFCVVNKDNEYNIVNALYVLPELQGQGLGYD